MKYYKVDVCIIEDLDNNVIYTTDHISTLNGVQSIIDHLDSLANWLSFTYEVTIVKYYEMDEVRFK